MILKNFANIIGRLWLKSNNKRVVGPPGEISQGTGTLLIIPTIMRSGTHLLIDTILNNFKYYRRRPLYIDLDRLADQLPNKDLQCDKLITGGNYVVKTHYPQTDNEPERTSFMLEIFKQSKIITVNRDIDLVVKSALAWGLFRKENEKQYRASIENFSVFWSNYESLSLDFDELVNPERYPHTVSKIGDYLNCRPRVPIIHTIPKNNPLAVYLAKGTTRLLGRHAPIINTTIHFNRTNC